jgi:DNA-binding NarL/FixJ family response regulator
MSGGHHLIEEAQVILRYLALGYGQRKILQLFPDLSAQDVAYAVRVAIDEEKAGQAKQPASHMEKVRAYHPNAYQRWTAEEEQLLLALHQDGQSVEEIARILQRQVSGIRSRLKKIFHREAEETSPSPSPETSPSPSQNPVLDFLNKTGALLFRPEHETETREAVAMPVYESVEEEPQKKEPRPARHRKKWTEREDAWLWRQYQAGMPDEEIADQLQRTPVAIDSRINKLRNDVLGEPRELGPHPQTGQMVVVQPGRFGPYITCGEQSMSVPREIDVAAIALPEVLALLAE